MAIKVDISWVDSNPTTHLDHFEIWRKTGSGGTYVNIGGNIGLGVQQYEDTNSGAGLTDGQEYFYQVRAYNNTNQYSEIESSIVASESPIIFQDTFTGTTLDASKWATVNADPAKVAISQNNELIFSLDGTGGASGYLADYVETIDSWDFATHPEIYIGIQYKDSSTTTGNSGFFINIPSNGSNDNSLLMFCGTTVNDLEGVIYQGGVNSGGFDSVIGLFNTYRTVKIKLTATSVSVYGWNNVDAWNDLMIDQAATFDTGIKIQLCGRAKATVETTAFDNAYVTTEDFSTQFPQ